MAAQVLGDRLDLAGQYALHVISARVATKARSERWLALKQLGGEAPLPVLRNPQLTDYRNRT